MVACTALVFSAACASSTVIRSEPSGATVYIDGSKVGQTPYIHTDTKTVSSTTRVKLRREGYEDFEGIIVRNEEFQLGPCIGGVFTAVPFLWIMGYKAERTYELTPSRGDQGQQPLQQPEPYILPPPPLPPTAGSP
jgi:hypothetical protein